MRSAFIPSLVLGIFWFSASANAVCCDARLHLTFTIKNGFCGDVGALGNPDRCSIIICADGTSSMTPYCGKGACNIFGCECEDGCLKGNWADSFLERYSRYKIQLLESEWRSGLAYTVKDSIPDIPKLPDIRLDFWNF